MDFLNFVMALSPIIVVLVGILGFRQSAKRVAPVALVWTLVLAFTFFNVAGATFKENVAVYSAMVGRIHMFGALVIPFIMVAMTFGRRGFRGIVPYLCFAGVSTGAVMFVLSNFVGAEVTSMGTGLLSILLSVAYGKLVGVKTPEEYRYHFDGQEKRYGAFRAMSPYVYMLALLPAFAVILVLYMALTMLYACVLFPSFGV